MLEDNRLDDRARRAASRVGLKAYKSQWRHNTIDNYGGFLLIDPSTNIPVFGNRWDLSAEDVSEFCRQYDA